MRRLVRRRPSKGKTATRWRGPEGLALVELVDDIRYDGYILYGHLRGGGKNGKKAYLPWKEVLRLLRNDGWDLHNDHAKLKADYKIAMDYWEAQYNSLKKG
jgi:hypothetical protein